MNDCEKYIELMSQMLDGELSEEQTSELRAHIASCEDCRKAFDAFTSVSEALSDELCEPPETCITASVLPWVGRIPPNSSGRWSICAFMMPVIWP